jgi:hypothetical protein
MNKKFNFDNKQEWLDAVKDLGLKIYYWGNNSMEVYDENDRVAGSWVAEFDCNNGTRPYGWLRS